MKRESLNISAFKPGDVITRLEKAICKTPAFNDNLGVETEVVSHADGSYRGDPQKYLGIANNEIVLKHLAGIFVNEIHTLPMEDWSDGWGRWEDPKLLDV